MLFLRTRSKLKLPMNNQIKEKNNISISEALFSVFILIALLAYNIFVAEGVLFGKYSNQLVLLIVSLMLDFL